MNLHLDLENFESSEAEGSRYVLTSPRSLEACSQMHVRPVHLLHKPIDDFVEENAGKPIELSQALYTNHESNRIELLKKCKEVRKNLIMQSELAARKKKFERATSEMNGNGSLGTTRSKSLSKLSSPHAQKVTKSLSYDVNNNGTDGEDFYEVIPYETKVTKKQESKQTITSQLSNKQNKFSPIKSLSSPRVSPSKTLKAVKGIPKPTPPTDDPYMISTPRGVATGNGSVHKYATVDKNWKMKKKNNKAVVKEDTPMATPRAERTSRTNAVKRSEARKRSKSVEVLEGRKHVNPLDQMSLFSSLSLGKVSKSGFTTPQMQKDQKMVDVMRDKRRQEAKEIKQRHKKMMEWEEEKKKMKDMKTSLETDKQKALAQSFREWEENLRLKEDKRKREELKMNKEREKQQNELEMKIKEKKDIQEKLRQEWIGEKQKNFTLKKKQQEDLKKSVEMEFMSFQEMTQQELDERFRKAERKKLEKEMKELNKIQMMNKRERERYQEIQKELLRQQKSEVKHKKKVLNEKMEKSAVIVQKKVLERDRTLKQRSKELNHKTHQTKRNKEELEHETEHHARQLAEQTSEKIVIANSLAEKLVNEKAERARQEREVARREQENRIRQLHKIEEEEVERMKEELMSKDMRSDHHLKLKEMAIELSRANARASEAARSKVKKKDQTFLSAMRNASLNAEIGKGLRTSITNQSSIKLG